MARKLRLTLAATVLALAAASAAATASAQDIIEYALMAGFVASSPR